MLPDLAIRVSSALEHSFFQRLHCLACDRPGPERLCSHCAAESEAASILRPAPLAADSQIDGLYFLGSYRPRHSLEPTPLRKALIRFKYGGDRHTGRRLARLFATAARPLQGAFDAVTAVPLHPHRLRERGFNQASWLARYVSLTIKARYLPGLLRRVRDLPPQAQSHSRMVRTEIRGAFVGRQDGIAPDRVLLIDDVYTTGTTAAACARALRAQGVIVVAAAVLLLVEKDPLPL